MDYGSEYVVSRPGLIGLGEDLPSASSICRLNSIECITHISSSSRHSAIVCASGRVYTLGHNDYHEWMEKITINEPTLVRDLVSHRITQAACGVWFTFFLTDDGQLFSSGWNGYGQLGLGNTTNSPIPTLVKRLSCVKKLATGDGHIVVITENKEVWVCGCNRHGQLGLGHFDNTCSFTRVPDLTEPIINVSCGSFFTVLLMESGNLIIAGSNDVKQLGFASEKKICRFQLVPLTNRVNGAVACGYYHTAALGMDGSVRVWGCNTRGQLGIPMDCKMTLPTKVSNMKHKIFSVFAGCEHTALITERGDVFVCGRGQSDELGQGREDISRIALLKKSPILHVQQIVFGDKYSLLIAAFDPRLKPSQLALQTVKMQTDGHARSCITDWERTIMTALECSVCFKMMSPPIQQCSNGHNLCGDCYSSWKVQVCPKCHGEFISTRNTGLECISSEVDLPCFKCFIRMPVVALNSHAGECSSTEN